jgi:arylsulfatase
MTGMILPETERMLPEMLRSAGYETASFGKLHFAPFGPSPVENCPSRELRWLWENSDTSPIEEDYYGFDRVEFCGGHGVAPWGHYRDWLRSQDADLESRLNDLSRTPSEFPDGLRDGWSTALPAHLHHSSWLGDIVGDYVREKRDNPFFAVVSYPDPHHPFAPPLEYADRYSASDMPSPVPPDEDDYAAWPPHFRQAYHGEIPRYSGGGSIDFSSLTDDAYRRIRALTAAQIELIDDSIGSIVTSLEDAGVRENTIIAFCSDHGDLLGDHGFVYKGPFHWDGIIRVPMVWNCPSRIVQQEPGSLVASHVDITPTLLDMCGVDGHPGIQGASIAGYLAGTDEYPRTAALTENDDDYVHERLRTMTTSEWKLTVYAGREYGELYDRVNDPGETRNLWDDHYRRGIRDDLRLALLDLVLDTQDRMPEQVWYA